MIEVIAEHSVDLSLLPEKANILDLGCRGFLFFDELTRRGHYVAAIDVDKLDTYKPYAQAAVTSVNGGYVDIVKSKDPQGTTVKQSSIPTDVRSYTINGLCGVFGIQFWDLIKIDIEGSEYEVIMSLTEPPAKQLSIESHLHTGIYGDAQVKEMEDKLLSLGYFPVKHDKTQAHGMGWNYWDSLWVMK